MKSVLISIQPKWVNKIASGEKTIEVRKTRPKLETPFKCYIYCTNGTQLVDVRKEKIYLDVNKPFLLTNGKSNNVTCSTPPQVNRKVIGEFVCDRIDEFLVFENGTVQYWNCHELEKSCLTYNELSNYIGKDRKGYAWHISDLVIYDKPKELGEFKKINRECWYSDLGLGKRDCPECKNTGCFIQRPPQSWCYVESLGE